MFVLYVLPENNSTIDQYNEPHPLLEVQSNCNV